MKYGKLRLEFTLVIKLGKQILMMPSEKRPVLSSSLCTYHLFRCSRCNLRFTFSVYIFPSITAHFTLQWDLLSYCITGAWRLKNYNLASHYEIISTCWDKFFSGRAIICVATLLLIHVGTSDTAKKDVEQITSDCRQIADWGQQWRMWEPMYSLWFTHEGESFRW